MASFDKISSDLRWLDFPEMQRQALSKLDELYFSLKSNGMYWSPEAFSREITEPFIFALGRDRSRSRLTTVHKLWLADMILSYFTYRCRGNEADRQALFNTIFCTNGSTNINVITSVLRSLTSLAIANRDSEVLKCIAVWMHNSSVDNPVVQYLAVSVTNDWITDPDAEKYNHLPVTSFYFTALILIAVGRHYRSQAPPARLVQQVTVWLETCPAVCFIPPQSAIFEIFRWCLNEEDNSRLQFALLNSIDSAGKGVQLQVIPQVMTLIQDLRVKNVALASNKENGTEHNPALIGQWTDCLFQLIQMLISAKCLDANEIHPIFEAYEVASLPPTDYYKIIRRMYYK